MKFLYKSNLEIALLFISIFSFIFLWDLSYSFWLQFRFLFLLIFFYSFFKNFNSFYINFKTAFLLSLFFLFHQILNVFYENTNEIFKKIKLDNLSLTSLYDYHYGLIYQHTNFLNANNILGILGLLAVIYIGFTYHRKIEKLFNSLMDAYLFFLLFFFIFFTNIFSLYTVTNLWSESSLCSFKYNFNYYIKLFLEKSHFGMIYPSILLLILYRISINFSKYKFLLLFICLFFGFINYSATLLVGFIISAFLVNISLISKKNYYFILLSLIFSAIIFSTLYFNKSCLMRLVYIEKDKDYFLIEDELKLGDVEDMLESSKINLKKDDAIVFSEKKMLSELDRKLTKSKLSKIRRYINTDSLTLTTSVHLNSLNLGLITLFDRPFGWGLNRYHEAFKFYQPRLYTKFKEIRSLNYNDGASNFSKMLVEFGVLCFPIFLFFVFFAFSNKIDSATKIFLMPIIITQMIRGAGYFNGGFSLSIILMICIYISNHYRISKYEK